MSFKNSRAERTTITRDTVDLEKGTGNIYESIVILSKRANQINVDLKEELTQKLQEFASTTDNLEEIFENREQRSEERRVGKSVDIGGRRRIKKKEKKWRDV